MIILLESHSHILFYCFSQKYVSTYFPFTYHVSIFYSRYYKTFICIAELAHKMHFCPQCIYELLFGSFLLCVIAKNSYKTYVWSEWVHFYKIIDLQKFQKEIRSMLWLQKKTCSLSKQNSFDQIESAPKNGFILQDILK